MIRLKTTVFSLLLFCLPAGAGEPSQGPDYESELRLDIADHLKVIKHSKVYQRRLTTAYSLLPTLLEQCWAHNVDPLLINAVIKKESSWKVKAVGKKGEQGLMQIMPGHKHLRGVDLFDGRVNLSAGIEILANHIRDCETLLEALSYYITGDGCQPVINAARRRLKAYRAAVKRYRK